MLHKTHDERADHVHHHKQESQNQSDIEAFHAHHAELERIAKRLHASGHNIHIDYKSDQVARHGKKTSTVFFNHSLNAEKRIQISKKMPLRPWD